MVRAGVAVIAQALHTVFTFIAVERFAQSPQSVQEGKEQTTAFGQDILDVRRTAAIITTLDEQVPLHIAQASDERAAADRMQRSNQLCGALRPQREIAHHEHRPLVAHQLQSARHRASIAFASSQSKSLLC